MTRQPPTITVRRSFSAAPERVFEAFRREESLARWFSPSPEVALEVLAFQFKPQGAFRFRYAFPDGSRSSVKGIYRSIVPPESLAFSWVWEAPDVHAGVPTEVKVAILPRGKGSEVVVTHERLPDAGARERFTAGWILYLERLGSHLFDAGSPAEGSVSRQLERRSS